MKRFPIFGLMLMFLVGCGEESTSPTSSVNAPPIQYSGYNVADITLDAPIDSLDLAVLAGRPELVDKINQGFGTVTLNLFYVDLRFTAGCLDIANDAYRLPALATSALEAVRARGITLENVKVNVELLTPSRLPSEGSDVPVLGLCGGDGDGFPTFGSPNHRSQLKSDFAALADLPGLSQVTVGVEMNALYHAGEQGEFGYDYSNYVTVYHEIYDAIKTKNANVRVGPGLSYRVFRQQTVPYASEQVLQLGECVDEGCVDRIADDPSTVYEAYRLVVEPLLTSGPFGMQTPSADFVGWSVIPSSAGAPFEGSPSFDELDGTSSPARRQVILDYFKPLLYAVFWSELPYGVVQSDWTGSRGKIDKAVFLDVLLTALSPNPPVSLGWRRMTDLPRDEITGAGSGNSICSQVSSPVRSHKFRKELTGSPNASKIAGRRRGVSIIQTAKKLFFQSGQRHKRG